MALSVSRSADEAVTASGPGGQGAAAYEREMEERVREILRGVSGVGEVDVMIVLKSSAEKVIQVDNSTSKSVTTEKGSGTDRAVESLEQEHSTVLTGSGSGQEPVVAKEVYRRSLVSSSVPTGAAIHPCRQRFPRPWRHYSGFRRIK